MCVLRIWDKKYNSTQKFFFRSGNNFDNAMGYSTYSDQFSYRFQAQFSVVWNNRILKINFSPQKKISWKKFFDFPLHPTFYVECQESSWRKCSRGIKGNFIDERTLSVLKVIWSKPSMFNVKLRKFLDKKIICRRFKTRISCESGAITSALKSSVFFCSSWGYQL